MQTSTPFELDIPTTRERIGQRLQRLYGAAGEDCCRQLLGKIDQFRRRSPSAVERSWDQTDVVLITYGDQIQQQATTPLAALRQFLKQQALDELLSTIHLLPFFPYSSDDGFSVIDYHAVDPALGSWQDIAQLGEDFLLAFDLVLNHVSSQSEWFAKYLRGEEPYTRFFLEVDPSQNLSAVTRPRSLPLLTKVETANGPRHVWTTFSADQIDLNFAEPEVLLAIMDVLLDYAARGAQIIRLDAIAFLWKEIGTSCIHLWQTHEVVKLMRDVLALAAPHVWLLTETNVPHRENVSYFGNGDEAQLVYQFSLPPLMLDAFTHGDATPLMQWLAGLEATPPGTTYLNFTASHDGVGVRPLEGLVPEERVASLVAAMQERGGLVSVRRRDDGVDVPYELNISYVDALAPDNAGDVALHARRFLASQAVMLALRGVPAIYFHSLVGTRNDSLAAEQSGQPRRINRRKFRREQLEAQMGEAGSLSEQIYAGYRRLLELRRGQPAFHPDARQTAIPTENPAIISFLREDGGSGQSILVLVNVGDLATSVDVSPWLDGQIVYNLMGDDVVSDVAHVELQPGQACWLAAQKSQV